MNEDSCPSPHRRAVENPGTAGSVSICHLCPAPEGSCLWPARALEKERFRDSTALQLVEGEQEPRPWQAPGRMPAAPAP